MKTRRWYHDSSFGSIRYLRESVVIALIVLFMLAFIAVCIGVAWGITEQGCRQQGDALGVKTDNKFWAGICYAEVDGRTVNIENVRENGKGQTIYVEPSDAVPTVPSP